MKLADASILITGGANGIGKQLAEHFVNKAKQVVIVDKDRNGLNSLKRSYPQIASVECDLTYPEKVIKQIETVYRNYPINVLINNAGIIENSTIISILDKDHLHRSFESWRKTIATNLDSAFYVTSTVAQLMAKNRAPGVIINMSSISASGNIGQSAYSAAKAGLNALTVSCSKELSMFGIRTVAIAPGFFDAGSTHEALSQAQVESWVEKIPLKKLGQFEELANTVEYVIRSDYINGRVLHIDGGLRI